MQEPVFGLKHTAGGVKVTSDKIKSFYTHTHMYNEMLWYEPFQGCLTVNNEEITVDSETVLLVTASDFHSTTVTADNGAKYLKIAFRDEVVASFLSARLSQPIVLKKANKNHVLCCLMKKCLKKTDDIDALKILVNAILLEITEVGTYLGSAVKKGTELLVLNALRIINERFFENITLQTVADELNITPQYLSSVFSRSLRISFSEYLKDKRLNYAAGLILENKYTVTEICYAAGFGNLSHFLRSFKKKYGLSPKTYAKQAKQ